VASQDPAVERTELYRDRLRAHAERVLGDRHEAEDVAQEVLIRAPSSGARSILAWLHAVCQRLAIDRLRARKRRARAALALARREAHEPEDELERASRARRLRAAVEKLDEPYRSALRLRYLEELSFPEVAARLDTLERTARTWVGRGLAKLRHELGESAS
jgi:RNA polymerase sigma-70 factor (ECF subfamily)